MHLFFVGIKQSYKIDNTGNRKYTAEYYNRYTRYK